MGQKVWLSTRELPLQVESDELAPKFVRTFAIEKVISPVAVQIKLPQTMRVHPLLHVSMVRLVSKSLLVPAAPSPPCLIDWDSPTLSAASSAVADVVEAASTSSTGRPRV